jgi:hypothetical protein
MSAPAAPDPYQVAAAQTQENKAAAQTQAEINMVNQTTPYGSLNYKQTGTAADGTPQFSATQSYTPQVQNLFNSFIGNQQSLGNSLQQFLQNSGDALTKTPNLDPTALTNKMMGWFNNYESPIWNQQQSNLNSQLGAQGITQGSAAYDNAQNLQARNVGDATNQFLNMAEPNAFNQAVTQYQLPFQSLQTLLGSSSPQSSVNQSLTQTPSEQIQPANLSGDIYSSYNANLNNYENTMSGIFGLGSTIGGGIAKMLPFSDIRMKENISRVGELENGLPIYTFNYKTDPDGIPQIGLMAQDVEQYNPDAVVYDKNGMRHLDYAKAVKGYGPKSK